MFGSLAPGMKTKVPKPKKPKKFKTPSMAYRGVTQQPMPPIVPPAEPAAQVPDEAGSDSVG